MHLYLTLKGVYDKWLWNRHRNHLCSSVEFVRLTSQVTCPCLYSDIIHVFCGTWFPKCGLYGPQFLKCGFIGPQFHKMWPLIHCNSSISIPIVLFYIGYHRGMVFRKNCMLVTGVVAARLTGFLKRLMLFSLYYE